MTEGQSATPSKLLLDIRNRLRRAMALDEDAQPGEMLEICQGVLDQLVDDRRLVARGRTIEALFLKAQALFDLDRPDDALKAIESLLEKRDDVEPALRRRSMHAIFVTVMTLRTCYPSRAEDALALCAEALRRFGGNPDPCVRERLLNTFVEQGNILAALDRPGAIRLLAADIVAAFGADPDGLLRERAAQIAQRLAGRLSI